MASNLPDSRVRDRLGDLVEARRTSSLQECATTFGATGYVVDSVPLAILVASSLKNSNVLQALQRAVKCGGDTDTIASMAGQIMGAAVGKSAIPDSILDFLPEMPLIQCIAEQFASSVTLC